MEKQILSLLEKAEPLLGSELWNQLGGDGLLLWRACRLSEGLLMRTLGTQYLRLDRRIPGFARLSPSIFREFLTYTVIGLSSQGEAVEKKCLEWQAHIEGVSRGKLDLAYLTMSSIAGRLDSETLLEEEACFIIAGDIVYNMAHDVPRPERSTGKLVNGSDMDIVVIVPDDFPEKRMKRLDDAIFQEKYRLLITPHVREEIDYVVKRTATVREQVRFDTFRHKLACKIIHEGTLLCGSEDLFLETKLLLRDSGAARQLEAMEDQARAFRREAEAYLLREDPEKVREESLFLFYPTDESEEFE
jgi:hypothetical protein